MKNLKDIWLEKYRSTEKSLDGMSQVKGVLSVFNSNIDAVKKITPQEFYNWLSIIEKKAIDETGDHSIETPADLIRGFLYCFERGIAQEWLVTNIDTFKWMEERVGYDHLQMGGQGGIIGNVMAVCGVEKVFVHAASLPKKQASLFVDEPNLLSTNQDGIVKKASSIDRKNDTPLIHWILEFNKGDKISLNGRDIIAPKSNRFIATWDPLNFKLEIDQTFSNAILENNSEINYCLLAGYQMLTANLEDGSKSIDKIIASKKVVDSWRDKNRSLKVHFEFASTQDKNVRKELLDEMGNWADSIGLNEQELIDLLEITNETELSNECKLSLSSVPLFKGLVKLFEKTGVERIQLHMFGLYLTVQKSECFKNCTDTQNGMILAASIAASKAGTGSIEKRDNLLWSKNLEIGTQSTIELENLSTYLTQNYDATDFNQTGILETENFDIVAIPTIIVDNPITLVGMGDTISSISLIGS